MKNKQKIIVGLIMTLLWSGGALTGAAAPVKLKVTAELANIRVKPSIGSVIIRQFPQGAVLDALSKDGDWYLVKLEPDESGAVSGYVHESLVQALGETPKTEQKPKIVSAIEQEKSKQPVVVENQISQTKTFPENPSAKKFGLVFSGGGTYAVVGDLNTGAQGLADFYRDQLNIAGDKKVDALHLNFMFGGEIFIPLSSQFYLSAGADFFSSSKASLVSYPRSGLTDTYAATPKIQAVPLKFSIIFYPVEFFYFKIGATYYFASCNYSYRFEHDKFWQEWTGEATGQGFGFWGGLGFEWAVSGFFSFIIEFTGQYAPIKGFEGTGTFQDSNAKEPVLEEGKLYAWDGRTSSQSSYPALFIRNKWPSEGGVENAREAKIDFSGISLRAGIKIKF